MSLVADSFRLLPKKTDAKTEWTAREWSKNRQGWIFITSQPAEREALRPLHGLWIDMLVLRLLSAPTPEQHPVWFVLDELASLQKSPQLHTTITEDRKSRNPIVLRFQGKAQLEVIYGYLAEVMLSQPATKIFLKATEPNAAEWVSRAIGKVEIERRKETHFDGSRDGRNFSLDRQTEPLVLDSEISGLENLNAHLKHGNYVTRFSFLLLEVPASKPKFIERLEDDFIVREPRKEQKEQPETVKNQVLLDSAPRAESKATSNGQNRQSAAMKAATATQEEGQANSKLNLSSASMTRIAATMSQSRAIPRKRGNQRQMGVGFAVSCQLAPHRRPLYPVLVHRLVLLIHASFRPRLATTPSRFSSPSPPPGWVGDSPPKLSNRFGTHKKSPAVAQGWLVTEVHC